MTTRVEILIFSSSIKEIIMSLLDLRCTRYLVSPQMTEKLGMRLRKPVVFFQLDGLITGRVPAKCLTNPMNLKAHPHRDYLIYCAPQDDKGYGPRPGMIVKLEHIY